MLPKAPRVAMAVEEAQPQRPLRVPRYRKGTITVALALRGLRATLWERTYPRQRFEWAKSEQTSEFLLGHRAAAKVAGDDRRRVKTPSMRGKKSASRDEMKGAVLAGRKAKPKVVSGAAGSSDVATCTLLAAGSSTAEHELAAPLGLTFTGESAATVGRVGREAATRNESCFGGCVVLDLAVWDDEDDNRVLWTVSVPVLLRSRGTSITGGHSSHGSDGETRYVLVHEDDERGWLWMELLANSDPARRPQQQREPALFSVQAAAMSLLLPLHSEHS